MRKTVLGIIAVVVVVLVVSSLHKDSSKPVAPTYKGIVLALGDSVAAGDGLKTDSDSSACNRTNEAYVHAVAASLDYRAKSVACSGATIAAGMTGQQNVNKLLVSPQIDQIAKIKPNLVTLTVGANDVGWTDFLTRCYTGQCGTDADTAAVSDRLAQLQADLTGVFKAIDDNFQTTGVHTVVTGYYQLLPVSGTCNEITGIDESERTWINQMQANISNTIAEAAKTSSDTLFVPVDFGGHELCTTDSWIQGSEDPAPFHPTAEGQAHFAKTIEAALKKVQNHD